MKDLLDKISSYNLFNNLLPGILFVVLASELTRFHLIHDNLFIGFFIYYFIGMVISRLGSLFIEKLLKNIKFVKFAPYEDYIQASAKDPTLPILSEVNNTFRSLISMSVLLLILKVYEKIIVKLPVIEEYQFIGIIIIFLLLFMYAYRKQVKYISDRVEAVSKKSNSKEK